MTEIDITQKSRIDLLKDGMVAEIKTIMPKLKTVEAIAGRFNLDQLQEKSFRAPAAFATILKSPFDLRADRTLWLRANCACFFVAEGREDKRDLAAWAMAEGFASILPNKMFGLTHVSVPGSIEIDPLISVSTREHNVTIIAVTWIQTIRALGSTIFDDELVLLEELYLNDDLDPRYVRPEEEQS